jgi:hypothetical protein
MNMKFQSVSALQQHSFVRFLPSLQPATRPPTQTVTYQSMHPPANPSTYLSIISSLHPDTHPCIFIYTKLPYRCGSRRSPSYNGSHCTVSNVSHSLAIAYTYLLHGIQQPFVGSVLDPALYPTLLSNQSFMTKNMTHFNCMTRCTIPQLMVVITTPVSWHSFQSYV